MDKAQRAELLRRRFKAKGGVAYVPTGKPLKPRHDPKPWRNMAWPEIIPDTKRVPKAWQEPIPAKPVELKTKRAAKVSPLTRIAEKWPIKPLRPAPNQSAR